MVESISLGSSSCRRALSGRKAFRSRDLSEFDEPRHLGPGVAFGNSLPVGTDQDVSLVGLVDRLIPDTVNKHRIMLVESEARCALAQHEVEHQAALRRTKASGAMRS